MLVVAVGCGEKNPVKEISAAQSGVEVRDTLVDSADLPTLHWNQWRGGSIDGVVEDREVATNWGESQNVRWKLDVPGRGHGSPIVVGDVVYLATAINDKQQQLVLAYDRKTGDQRWRREVHAGQFPSQRSIHNKSTNANGTIACDGQRLYIGFLNNDKVMVSALGLDGEIVWQKEAGLFVSKFGYAVSPILYKSLVIVAADNMGGGYITAMDGQTGEIAWRVARGNISSYSSPTVANVGGRDQLLISGCDAVTSYDPATGKQLWRTECISEATCGTIVSTDNLLFASGGYPDKETVCLSAAGEILWSNRTKIYEPSMVLLGDELIGVSDDGVANCWSVTDGKQVWRKRLGGNFSASPIVCNDTVYVSDLSGNTHVFKSVDGEFQSIATNQVGTDCYASPAVADTEIYLRVGVGSGDDRTENLVCIKTASPAI
ncbi:outer membrane biogenesis protein BamB [Planctomycetes bacterium K23_9]|uniref:Outer membrane biogenesis protein BamB n=2 Tax=Stieleria marina TaxID=1930275 RepID=A0A517NRM4_9BACT|nr:outer membrane biogenesis protein BamB [Planctomycetes bacterium K23_9]